MEEQITSDNINRVYAVVPKTLRLVVSLGSRCFDMNGVATLLVAQLRTTISKITQTANRWDARIAPSQWNFFAKQLIELNKASLYEYKRIPSSALVKGKDISLICLADAGRDSMVMTFYLVYNTKSGHKVSSLPMARSYLVLCSTHWVLSESQDLNIFISNRKALNDTATLIINSTYIHKHKY